jgi:hypothetical protein
MSLIEAEYEIAMNRGDARMFIAITEYGDQNPPLNSYDAGAVIAS